MRSRNIKPGFFHNDDLVECSFPARILFVGLWCLADRAGYLEDRPKKIKIQVFPADSVDCDELLCELSGVKLILRYTNEDGKYIWIPGFRSHQNPHRREKPSTIQPHPDDAKGRPGPEEKKPEQDPPKDMPRTDQGQTQDEPGNGRARLIPDSGFLIPDSLIPDSGNLNNTHQPSGSDEPEGTDPEPDPLEKFSKEIVAFVTSFNSHIVAQWKKSAPEQTADLVFNSCDTVDKLIRLDNFTLDEIRNATWWACNHHFWSRQVKSLAPLRKKGDDKTTKFQKIYDESRAAPVAGKSSQGNNFDAYLNNACNEIMEDGYGSQGSGSDGAQIFQPEEPEG